MCQEKTQATKRMRVAWVFSWHMFRLLRFGVGELNGDISVGVIASKAFATFSSMVTLAFKNFS